MKFCINISAFLILILSNLCFSFNWFQCNNFIYLTDGKEKYTYGELIYQLGVVIGLMFLFVAARISEKYWLFKIAYNWIIQVYLIAIFFTSTKNPYGMNWDKMLVLEISVYGMFIVYMLCYLFPPLRKWIL